MRAIPLRIQQALFRDTIVTAVWEGGIGPNDGGMRAGAHVLRMTADPINRNILRTLSERRVWAGPNHHLEITARGREGLFVAFVVERWLQDAPGGPIEFGGDEAEETVAALAEGWSSSAVHVLARGPCTLQELRGTIDGLGRRALTHTLSAMTRAGLVELRAGGDVYAPSDWLRAGIAALIAAARVERRDPDNPASPIDALDVEAAFLLALPLLELPEDLTGSCRLGVGLEEDRAGPVPDAAPDMAGLTARIDAGRVVACEPALDPGAETWAAGSASDWLDTVIEADAKRVRTGGDKRLAALLLNRLHETLFGVPTTG